MVKANAYGHGLTQVAKYIQNSVDELAVATIDEAIELAENSIIKPINILGNIDKSCVEKYNYSNIYPTVATIDDIKYLISQKFLGGVNVKVNTGMNRIGANIFQLKTIVDTLYKNNILIKSFYTHFYNSSDILSVESQFEIFQIVKKKYSHFVNQFHVCASNCLQLSNNYYLDMVRVGIALYGYQNSNLLPAFTVKTNILQILSIKKGDNIGYGCYKAVNDCIIAAIRVGYGDGYRRIINTKRYVSVCGKLCPIVGQVCMDICMVDITNTNANINTQVFLINNVATLEDLAKSYQTINYEVLTSFNSRAKRVYVT